MATWNASKTLKLTIMKNNDLKNSQWCIKVYANNTPADVLRWRQYMAKYYNNNLSLDGRWSADGYINQDGWWLLEPNNNEITLDEFGSFFYPHKKLKNFRLWKIKI